MWNTRPRRKLETGYFSEITEAYLHHEHGFASPPIWYARQAGCQPTTNPLLFQTIENNQQISVCTWSNSYGRKYILFCYSNSDDDAYLGMYWLIREKMNKCLVTRNLWRWLRCDDEMTNTTNSYVSMDGIASVLILICDTYIYVFTENWNINTLTVPETRDHFTWNLLFKFLCTHTWRISI